MRVNISLAIVDMTNKANKVHYNWNLKTQSYVLSSFFWGYVVMMIPCGILTEKFGAKMLLAYGMLINAVCSALTPLSADVGGWQLVSACRVVQGVAQSPIFPALQQQICQWVPLEEKGLLAAIILGGSQLGIAVQLSIAGFIATTWGWPAIFYTNSATSAIWFIAYMIFGSESPERSRYVSAKEVAYIQKSLGRVGEQKKYPIPWKDILKCVPFIATVIAHSGSNWGFFTLMIETPTYMAKVLNVNLSNNGLLSSLPYITAYFFNFVTGSLTDLIKRRQWLSVTNSRKLFNTLAFWVPALSLIGLSYAGDNATLIVSILVITATFSSAQYCGHMLIHSDLTPNFSSVLFGICNFVASFMPIIAPLVCGFIIQDEKDPGEWRKVFILASLIYFITNLIFIIFTSAKRQEWNEPKPK